MSRRSSCALVTAWLLCACGGGATAAPSDVGVPATAHGPGVVGAAGAGGGSPQDAAAGTGGAQASGASGRPGWGWGSAITPPDADAGAGAPDASAATDAGAPPDASAPADAGPDAAPSDELIVTPAMFTGPGIPLVPIADGDAITLSLPPQGGHVLFIGAIMRNLHTDTVVIHGRVLDPATGALVAEETRTVVVQPVDGDPGASQTNIQTYTQSANVTLCPDYADTAIDGQPYRIEITIKEIYVDVPRTATGSRLAIPTCTPGTPDTDLCTCECAASYAIGKCPPGKKG